MPSLKLSENMCASGWEMAVSTNFIRLGQIPKISELLLGSRLLITARTSPPVISSKLRIGGFSFLRKALGFNFVFGMQLAMFFLLVEKNRLKLFAIFFLSEVKLPLMLSSTISLFILLPLVSSL